DRIKDTQSKDDLPFLFSTHMKQFFDCMGRSREHWRNEIRDKNEKLAGLWRSLIQEDWTEALVHLNYCTAYSECAPEKLEDVLKAEAMLISIEQSTRRKGYRKDLYPVISETDDSEILSRLKTERAKFKKSSKR